MSQQGFLFIMPTVTVFDLLGNLATGGTIGFYTAANHVILKDIFQDAALTIPWENPIPLNAIGEPELINTLIYLATDVPYFVQFKDQDGGVLEEYDNYPYPTSATPVVPDQNIQNFVPNPGFSYIYEIPTTIPDAPLNIAPGNWWFQKDNISAQDTLAFIPFAPGQTVVPGNPIYEMLYTCAIPGTSETIKRVYVQFDNVQTFSGASVAFDSWLRSPTNSSVELQVIQNFGENGSPQVITAVETYSLNPSKTNFNSVFTVPSVSGKTIGLGSNVLIAISMPTNSIATVGVAAWAIYESLKVIDYQEVPSNVAATQSLASQYPLLNTELLPTANPADGYYDLVLAQGATAFSLAPRAGIRHYWCTDVAPSYALLENGVPFYSAEYYNLAHALYNSITLSLPHGVGPQGFTALIVGATVTVSSYSFGLVSAGSAQTSGVTYTQVALGDASTVASATILFPAGVAVTPGSYFFINAPAVGDEPLVEYYGWFSLFNQTADPGTDPLLTDKVGIKIVYTGTETAAQLAEIGMVALQVAQCRVPDTRGLFVRGRNAGATAVFPAMSQLTLTSTGNAAISIVVNGLDMFGEAITETITGPDNATVTSVKYYSAITSIIPASNIAVELSGGNASNNAGIFPLQTGTATVPLILNGIWMRDPDYAQRTITYLGTETADNSPSKQLDQFKSHTHLSASNLAGRPTGNNNIDVATDENMQPHGATGGNQTNPINIYATSIIYI